jgi:glycosyltransferase involved in cell wall biosynthesis
MEKKLVSVVIPAYNRAKVLYFSLDSVVSQTYKNLEIIVVDDASNDDTAGIVAMYIKKDSRVRYVKHENNKGGSAARNTGIECSNGEFIAFLDSDDAWYPKKIETQLRIFTENPSLEIIFSSSDETKYPSNTLIRRRIIKNSTPLKDLYKENIFGTTSSVICRATLLREIGGFDTSLKSAQDWDVYLRAVKSNNYFSVETPLLNHTEPEFNDKVRISSNRSSLISGLITILSKVTALIKIQNDIPLNKSDKNRILCRLNYKIAKIYFEINEILLAKKYLKEAQKNCWFDLRCLRLTFLIKKARVFKDSFI